MKSCEPLISDCSDYYVYVPGPNAREMFFYPLYIGHFFYEPGYSLHRESYDSFLVMSIRSGSMSLEFDGKTAAATEGSFVLLDCFKPHSYCTYQGCEALWCHFDGPLARSFYRAVTERLGNVFCLNNPWPVTDKLLSIYQLFARGSALKEPLLSKYLSDILTAFLLSTPLHMRGVGSDSVIEDVVSYINEHFSEDLPGEALAARAAMSPYHFIRTFKRETGFTPHEYIIHLRINTAKYLLKNTDLSVKDICFRTGFSGESVFCSSFKKHQGLTPLEYRTSS